MQKTNDNQTGVINPGSGKKKNDFFKSIINSIKKDYAVLILSAVSFLVLAVICFFGVTKNLTIAAFSLSEYEVGMIADRNIDSDRALPATAAYPFAIGDHERIIKKGFPITDENYKKLEKMANTKEYIDYRAYADTLLYLFLLMILWVLLYSDKLLGRKPSFKELLIEIILRFMPSP